MKIDRFTEKYRFLSNFYPSAVTLDGVRYDTVEHAFQAAKTTRSAERRTIREASSAKEAKRLGQLVLLRPGWEEKKVGVMRELLRRKFRDPRLRAALLATGTAELIEGNTWGDRFWGVCRGKGENWLGKLLVDIRAFYATLEDGT